MTASTTDTIAAISTAVGEAAVSVIRISGPGALKVADSITAGKASGLQPRRTRVLTLREPDGAAVDHALALYFRGPASYTGDDVVEFHCHGGVLLTQKVLSLALGAGARAAEAGEFTQRAFLNGKLDLSQAEAVMDLIQAQSSLALRAANEQLEGAIGKEASAMREELVEVLAHVEAYIDFPEEDIAPEVGAALLRRLDALLMRCNRMLATSEHGRILRQGARTVICGQPNVGKSSLLNLLLGFDRAIVSQTAGTTRDTIEEIIQVHGVPLRLVDTAGLRMSEDEVEQVGIQRSEKEISRADLILEVVDGSRPENEAQRVELPVEQVKRRLLIMNKADICIHPSWADQGIALSCKDGQGVENLRQQIRHLILQDGAISAEHPVAINARHKACFERVQSGLQAARQALLSQTEPEFLALELRETAEALGEVTGRVDIEDILDVVFSRFCIGK